MTDEEIICGWMGGDPRTQDIELDDLEWWSARRRAGNWEYAPIALTLDRLHEVEARLTKEQYKLYMGYLADWTNPYFAQHPECEGFSLKEAWRLVHATPEQKISALASVLRAEAERVAGKEQGNG